MKLNSLQTHPCWCYIWGRSNDVEYYCSAFKPKYIP